MVHEDGGSGGGGSEEVVEAGDNQKFFHICITLSPLGFTWQSLGLACLFSFHVVTESAVEFYSIFRLISLKDKLAMCRIQFNFAAKYHNICDGGGGGNDCCWEEPHHTTPLLILPIILLPVNVVGTIPSTLVRIVASPSV